MGALRLRHHLLGGLKPAGVFGVVTIVVINVVVVVVVVVVVSGRALVVRGRARRRRPRVAVAAWVSAGARSGFRLLRRGPERGVAGGWRPRAPRERPSQRHAALCAARLPCRGRGAAAPTARRW